MVAAHRPHLRNTRAEQRAHIKPFSRDATRARARARPIRLYYYTRVTLFEEYVPPVGRLVVRSLARRLRIRTRTNNERVACAGAPSYRICRIPGRSRRRPLGLVRPAAPLSRPAWSHERTCATTSTQHRRRLFGPLQPDGRAGERRGGGGGTTRFSSHRRRRLGSAPRRAVYLVTAGQHSWLKYEADAYKPMPILAVLSAEPSRTVSDIS